MPLVAIAGPEAAQAAGLHTPGAHRLAPPLTRRWLESHAPSGLRRLWPGDRADPPIHPFALARAAYNAKGPQPCPSPGSPQVEAPGVGFFAGRSVKPMIPND